MIIAIIRKKIDILRNALYDERESKVIFMNEKLVSNTGCIVGMQVEESFGKYGISCRVGAFCNFDLNQISNQLHQHNCYELCIVTSGSGLFIHRDRKYKLEEGDVFMADPYTVHEVQANRLQNLQLIYFFLEIKGNESLRIKGRQDRILHAFISGHKVLAPAQKHLLSYFVFIESYHVSKKSRSFGIEQALKNLILESLEALSTEGDHLSSPQAVACNTLELSLDFIDNNLNRQIKLEEIAKHACTSCRNLQFLFNKHLGKTVIEYINERKIALAAHYLIRQFSVHDTANLVGIDSPSRFTRLFKKYKTVTPKKYQQIHATNEKGFGRRLNC